MAATPVSPKVTASATTAAATTLAMYLLGQIGFVAAFPAEVKLALLVIVTSAVTFAAGYIKSDPLRTYLAKHRA